MDPEHFALLEEARRSLPDGFKVELSGDTIVMTVSPSGIHQRNLLMGIPLYLLIDARQKTVTLFSRPDGTRYHRREDIEFGETLHIPEPFDFDLVTTELLPY
ncbi:hypothetical protein [Kitasatospora sp. NPDC057015]|uniref:hypothetical protein n=1 Tax=Kitasatospora sp. NPDC057015 TaxID=3346001 RepID=UPI0036279A50